MGKLNNILSSFWLKGVKENQCRRCLKVNDTADIICEGCKAELAKKYKDTPWLEAYLKENRD